jgi:hypothetical protein
MCVLPVPLLPTAMMFSRRVKYSERASSRTRALLSDGMAATPPARCELSRRACRHFLSGFSVGIFVESAVVVQPCQEILDRCEYLARSLFQEYLLRSLFQFIACRIFVVPPLFQIAD